MNSPLDQIPYHLRASEADSRLDHLSALDIDSKPSFTRLTGIICTIGKTLFVIHLNNSILKSITNERTIRSCVARCGQIGGYDKGRDEYRENELFSRDLRGICDQRTDLCL
jgi:hypothetical protein